MSVEDIDIDLCRSRHIIEVKSVSSSKHGIQHNRKEISGVHVSSGSAGTLVRRGGIANDRLILYSLSNISAKNY